MADINYFDLNEAETGTSVSYTPSVQEAQDRFMQLAAEVGLDRRDIHFGVTEDIVRCATLDDKPGKKSGWYVIHEERGLMYGALGNWKSDAHYVTFTGRDAASIDSDLMRVITEKAEARKREAAELRRRAAQEAARLVATLSPATPSHPYLQRKQIGPCGALQWGASLLLPISDLDGNLVSTQEIAPDGEKTFRAGCTSKGVFVIGKPTPTIALCEGFATGASIHEATGMRVYVMFNAGTLASMAGEIAEREGTYGGARIVIAADNDHPNVHGVNVGYQAAQKASEACGNAEIIIPPEAGQDWNDIAILQPSLLRQAFSRAKPLFFGWQVEDDSLLPKRSWLPLHPQVLLPDCRPGRPRQVHTGPDRGHRHGDRAQPAGRPANRQAALGLLQRRRPAR
jgi:putative DNA primase/helicase